MGVNPAVGRLKWAVGDLTVSGGGRVMRVLAIGQVRPDTATLAPDADPGGEREHVVTVALIPMPGGAETITCLGCLWKTHLWIDATHTNRSSGARMRLIRCSSCFVDAMDFRDCAIHTTSTTVRPHHLARRRSW
ncbi:hypothetical protein [Planotetraspora kaengkrachanensis]|uniref:Uncharacterized protein n=1 Tax=Planotetraspora kaengkrachanensis TaxID=575193 RepID=A0A8J3LY40_9ACTN|nr:hypothetical protein [Planotetraspora kaengkrachanensis]GIG79979.1 hypothetical protein Pka01_31060 [Planotetraspora kaengkrachanensis]